MPKSKGSPMRPDLYWCKWRTRCDRSPNALSFCVRERGQSKAADIPCALLFRLERADARRT